MGSNSKSIDSVGYGSKKGGGGGGGQCSNLPEEILLIYLYLYSGRFVMFLNEI